MLKTLHTFTRSLFPFIEIIFLSFIFGIAMESSAFAIVTFLFLIVTVYIWPRMIRSIGWGVAIFILLFQIPSDSGTIQTFINLIVGILAGSIRYLLIKITR